MAGFISGNATLSAGSVSTTALADDAVTLAKIASGAVSTAELVDNAVTLAKMAGGTDGNLIGIDASGDPAYIATGSDGQVLTSGGANVAALMEDAAAGGTGSFVEKVTCSGNATEELGEGVIETGYIYRLHFLNVKPSTDAHVLVLIGTGGGPTYQTGSYRGSGWRNSGTIYGTSGATSSVQLGQGAGGLSTGETMNATMRIMTAAETIETKFYANGTWQDSVGYEGGFAIAGYRNNKAGHPCAPFYSSPKQDLIDEQEYFALLSHVQLHAIHGLHQ